MSGYMIKDNGNNIEISEKVLASTCKAKSYKAIYVKNGKITNSKPKEFDFFTDNIYIVASDKITFPATATLNDLPPEPNTEYDSRELFDSLLALGNRFQTNLKLDSNIKSVIKWCEKYGFPFFGDDGFPRGDIGTCYKNTKQIGFSYKRFWHDVHHLYFTFLVANSMDQDLYVGINLSPFNTRHQVPYKDIKSKEFFIVDTLNALSFQRTTQYYFDSNHVLIRQTGYKTLLSLAYHQFAVLLLSPKGMSAKCCECCGALFAVTHNRKKYCPNCSPQKRYAQSKRKNTKQIK